MNIAPVLKDFQDTIAKLIKQNERYRAALTRIRDTKFAVRAKDLMSVAREICAEALKED